MAVRRFGPFELDLRAGELRREGVPVKLQPQPFRVLALLVERAGELVTREELKKALWGKETYVDFERGLNFCINQVRAALGDSADAPQFVQTLPRRGYRFIGVVPRPDHVPTGVDSGSDEGRTMVGTRSDPGLTPNRKLNPPWTLTAESTLNARMVLTGVAFLAILVAGATFLARRTTPPAPARDAGRTMIAVLPLEDLTGDPPPSWFADGLTDELIAQVGRVSPQRLGVIARTSAMTYRGAGKSIGEIGRELRVSHVVEGSLRREGTRLRITVRLVDVVNQAPVWSETYERSVHGALTIQSEIAAQVTRALALELLAEPWATPTWTGTHNPEARDALLRGKYFLNRAQPGDLRTALTHFDEAVRRDPSFAPAYAAQTDTYHLLAMFGQMMPADAYTRATAAAERAVQLDPNLGDAHAAMGIADLWARWDPSSAERSFERAVLLNPSDAAAHHDLAWALVALERFDEAIAHIRRARDLDPLSPRASNDIGWLYLQLRQPTEAIRACRETLSLDPESAEAQQCLERAYLQRGDFSEAIAAATAAAARSRNPVPAVLQESGAPADRIRALWQWRLENLQRIARDRYISPYTMAMHHIVLGQHDEALASLEEGYRTRSGAMVLMPTDPLFEPLRANPRFTALVANIRRRSARSAESP